MPDPAKHLLIVDDEKALREAVAERLADQGFVVEQADSGEEALRQVFGPSADRIVVANTKGYTGHPMAVGIEDVMAVKALETGLVPPVPNLREPDPELGGLNLSEGGAYPVQYALRLGAGFGSQIGMSLLRWLPNPDGVLKPGEILDVLAYLRSAFGERPNPAEFTPEN